MFETEKDAKFAILQYNAPDYAASMEQSLFWKIRHLLNSPDLKFHAFACFDFVFYCKTYVNWRASGLGMSDCNQFDKVVRREICPSCDVDSIC
jgi:hypothetical protein